MRTLIFWALGLFASLLIFSGVLVLCDDVEPAPTVIDAIAFREQKPKQRWVKLEDATLLWRRGIRSYRMRKDGEGAKKRIVYYVPIVPTREARRLASKSPDAESIVVLARIDEKTAIETFGFETDKSIAPKKTDVPCVGIIRRSRGLSDVAKAKLNEKFPGIDQVEILDFGREPTERGAAWGTLVFGLLLGFVWDRWRRNRRGGAVRMPQRELQVTVFSMLGKVAKADGRVSPEEIAAVEHFMSANEFDASMRQTCIGIFNRAKDDPHDIGVYARRYMALRPPPGANHHVYGLLISVACADGSMGESERAMLKGIEGTLGLSSGTFEEIVAEILGSAAKPLSESYAVLGVDERASDDEVKQAYRDKMRKFHPDKLQGKDLADEFLEYAKEQSQALQAAYDAIMKSRRA
ncbi:MAG: TerB family tellurite resistance protein [Planctomycetota bacterium]